MSVLKIKWALGESIVNLNVKIVVNIQYRLIHFQKTKKKGQIINTVSIYCASLCAFIDQRSWLAVPKVCVIFFFLVYFSPGEVHQVKPSTAQGNAYSPPDPWASISVSDRFHFRKSRWEPHARCNSNTPHL